MKIFQIFLIAGLIAGSYYDLEFISCNDKNPSVEFKKALIIKHRFGNLIFRHEGMSFTWKRKKLYLSDKKIGKYCKMTNVKK